MVMLILVFFGISSVLSLIAILSKDTTFKVWVISSVCLAVIAGYINFDRLQALAVHAAEKESSFCDVVKEMTPKNRTMGLSRA